MSDQQNQGKPPENQRAIERKQRAAEALRANLRRRKEQQQQRQEGENPPPEKPGASS